MTSRKHRPASGCAVTASRHADGAARGTGRMVLPGGIELELLGSDELMHRVAAAYWSRSPAGRWLERVYVIADRFALGDGPLAEMLRPHALAFDPGERCPQCGTLAAMANRSACRAPSQAGAGPALCMRCATDRATQREKIMQSAIAEWCRRSAAGHREPLTLEQAACGTPLEAWAVLAVLHLHAGGGEVLDAHGWSLPGRGESGLLGARVLDGDLVGELVEHGYLLPDPSSPAEAFEWDEAGRIIGCSPLQMRYRTPWAGECGVAESAVRLERLLGTVRWHRDELLESWYAIAAADVAGYIDRLAQFRYGQGPLPDHKARELAAAIAACRPELSTGQLTSTAWSATRDASAWDQRTPARHESANTRVAAASASLTLKRVQHPLSFERKSFEREPLLHPWSTVATLYLGHLLGDEIDWQHSAITAASLRPSLLCECERFAEPGAVLEGWPGGYVSPGAPSAPTLAGYQRAYLNGHRHAGAREIRQTPALEVPDAQVEKRLGAMQDGGLDLADERIRTWLGVITARALICTRMLADRGEISRAEWCAAYMQLCTDLTVASVLDQRRPTASGTVPQPRGTQADAQRRQVSAWLLHQLAANLEGASRSALSACWELVEFPGAEYRPPAGDRGRAADVRLAPEHWASSTDPYVLEASR